MIRVLYKGINTLMVYFIPAIRKGIPPNYADKGKRQYPENMCYLGVPFHKIVSYKDIIKINSLHEYH